MNGFVLCTRGRYLMLVNLLKQDVRTGPFMDFEVKQNMRIAPSCRVPDLDVVNMAKCLDEQIVHQVNELQLMLFSCCLCLASDIRAPDLSAINEVCAFLKSEVSAKKNSFLKLL